MASLAAASLDWGRHGAGFSGENVGLAKLLPRMQKEAVKRCGEGCDLGDTQGHPLPLRELAV